MNFQVVSCSGNVVLISSRSQKDLHEITKRIVRSPSLKDAGPSPTKDGYGCLIRYESPLGYIEEDISPEEATDWFSDLVARDEVTA